MIDVMTRTKIHHLAQGGVLQAEIAVQCGVGLRSVERILREPTPSVADIVGPPARRQGRPPKADAAMVERILLLLAEQPDLPATEVLRRAREWGFQGGRSQTAHLVKKLRPTPRK